MQLLFPGWWVISGLCLLVLALAIGKSARTSILVDSRGRYSLNHFQVVLWTLTILSAFVAALVMSDFDTSKIKIGNDLLGLMGIAVASAVGSTAVKGVKDAPGSDVKVAREGSEVEEPGGDKKTIAAKVSQIWLEEEGQFADQVISITKFQGFIFTLVAWLAFIALALKAKGLPALPEELVWLLGISQAGYVGGKVPDKK
jgi:hypothetical protein